MPSTEKESTKRPCTVRRFQKVLYTPGGVPTLSNDTLDYGSYGREVVAKSWSRTPNYFALVKARAILPERSFNYTKEGRDIYTPFYGIKSQYFTNGTYFIESYDYPYHLSHRGVDSAVGDLLNDSLLATKILERAKSNQWNVPIFLAEAKKTASMVIDTAKTLVNVVRNLRKGRINQVFKDLKITKDIRRKNAIVRRFNKDFGRDAKNAAANAWLATSYGWKPLMKDVQNATNTLLDMAEGDHNRKVATVRASIFAEKTLSTGVVLESSPNLTCLRTQKIVETRRMVWRCKIKPADLPARFGLVNPLEVAWELVPFSFVADWFLPIGDYLSSLDAPLRYDHVSGSKGLKRTTKNLYTNHASSYWSTIRAGQGYAEYVHVERNVVSSIPSPSLVDVKLKFSLGANQVTSGIALLNQQLSRLYSRR